MSEIYLLIEGQQTGPYTEEQIREALADGTIPPDLQAWREGLQDWVQVGGLVAEPQGAAPDTPVDRGNLDQERTDTALKASLAGPPFPQINPSSQKSVLKYVVMGFGTVAAIVVLGIAIGAGVWLITAHPQSANQNVATDLSKPQLPAVKTIGTPPPDGGVSLKISYSRKDRDVIMVNEVNGGNELAVYSMPPNFSEGDVWEGTLYPAGVWINGTKRYHAFATSKMGADTRLKIQQENFKDLPVEIEAYKKMIGVLNTAISVDQQAGMEADALQAQQKRDQLQRKLEAAQEELSAWQ